MANAFKFVGKLSISKGSDKFKPYTEQTSTNGWRSRKLIFNVKSNNSMESCELFGGYSEKNPVVYGYTKGSEGKKGESVVIPWKDRNKEEIIEKQASWKLSTIKLGEATTLRYLSQYDMIGKLKEMIESGEYKDKNFVVTGTIEYQTYKEKMYTKYLPQRIVLVEDDETEEVMEGTIELHFGENAITDNFEDNKKLFLNGFTMQYDSTAKGEVGVKMEGLELDLSTVEEEKAEKMYKLWKNKVLKVDGEEFNKIGLKVKFINGTERVEFTEDMLDEEQRELIEMGLLDFEDVKKEMSSGYGEKVKAVKVVGLAKGYSKGAVETGKTLEDYLPKVEVFEDEIEEEKDDLDLDDLLDLEDM